MRACVCVSNPAFVQHADRHGGAFGSVDVHGRTCCVLEDVAVPSTLSHVVWHGCPFTEGRTRAMPTLESDVSPDTRRFLLSV